MTEPTTEPTPTGPEDPATPPVEPSQGPDDTQAPAEPPEDAETFPRVYVERLRRESAEHRTRAADRDDLAHRLHGALVAGTGRLADPTDLPFDDAHLTDEASLSVAIDDLLGRKPHLAARRVVGDVGQGVTHDGQAVDLAGLLRRSAT